MRRVIFMVMCMLCWTPNFGNAESPRHISLATLELSPYVVCPKNASPSGTCVHVIHCVLEKMGIEHTLHVVPWARAQAMAFNGEVDGFFPASRTDTRDSFASLSLPFNQHTLTWYVRKDCPYAPDKPSFKAHTRCACFRGTSSERWLTLNGYTISYRAKDYDNLHKVLLAKRVDAVLASNGSMDEVIRIRNSQDIIQASYLMDAPLGVYFTHNFLRENPDFLERFNAHVRECRDF